MVAAVIAFGVLSVLLLVGLVYAVHAFLADIKLREDAMNLERVGWVEERRELLNRIQRPEYVPVSPAAGFEIPELEPDGIEEVGTIVFDPDAIELA